MKKNIAILLPYKERYSYKDAAAASIWVKDYLKISNLNKETLVFGYLPKNKKPLTRHNGEPKPRRNIQKMQKRKKKIINNVIF